MKKKPKVSDKEVKEILKKHKSANRNETYGKKKGNIVIVKKGKKKP